MLNCLHVSQIKYTVLTLIEVNQEYVLKSLSIQFKVILLLVLLACTNKVGFAQRDTFKQLEKQYLVNDFKYLHDNPMYRPSLALIGSLVYSGMGHFYVDEWNRGFKFMVSELILDGVITAGAIISLSNIDMSNENGAPAFLMLTIVSIGVAGTLGTIGLRAWSSIDAMHIAKVKSVAYHHMQERSMRLELAPFVNYQNYIETPLLAGGITLKVRF